MQAKVLRAEPFGAMLLEAVLLEAVWSRSLTGQSVSPSVHWIDASMLALPRSQGTDVRLHIT